MKDYYRILQVDAEAEDEVIQAAYRRLMQKYHPDVATTQSAETLRKVQDLNEAYATLSDPDKRRTYDQQRKAPAPPTRAPAIQNATAKTITPSPEVETEYRSCLVKCAKTGHTFKIHLGRYKNVLGPFSVLDFELMAEPPPATPNDLWTRLSGMLTSGKAPPAAPEIELNFSEIDWNSRKCPDCAGEIVYANNTRSHWIHCGHCHKILCSGNAYKQLNGHHYCKCPWCGKLNKLGRLVPLGSQGNFPVRSQYEAPPRSELPRPSINNKPELERPADSQTKLLKGKDKP